MLKEILKSIQITLVLCVLTSIIYPLIILGVGLIFPYQANGSIISNSQNQIIGSALIGQNFTADKYFWSRPSAINYNQGKDALTTGASGPSNLAPSNPDLIKRIKEEQLRWQQAGVKPTADLLYSSGSGLDPHISPQAAQAQIERVASSRGIAPDKLQTLISQNTDPRFLGIFGEPGVNVLKLNLALEEATGKKKELGIGS